MSVPVTNGSIARILVTCIELAATPGPTPIKRGIMSIREGFGLPFRGQYLLNAATAKAPALLLPQLIETWAGTRYKACAASEEKQVAGPVTEQSC